MTGDERVPGAGGQRVDVHAAAASRWADDHPPVRRTALLAHVPEEILLEVLWHVVIFEQGLRSFLVPEGSVEDVERRVVAHVRRVVDVVVDVVELEPHRVPVVVAANLELVPAKLGAKLVVGPLGVGRPAVHGVGDDAGTARPLEALDELLDAHVLGGDALDVVAQTIGGQHLRVVRVAVLLPLAAADGELGARRALRRPDLLLASLERGELALALLAALLVRDAAGLAVGILTLGLLLVVLGVVARLVARLGEDTSRRAGRIGCRRLLGRGDARAASRGLDRRCGHGASALGPRDVREIPPRATSAGRRTGSESHCGGSAEFIFFLCRAPSEILAATVEGRFRCHNTRLTLRYVHASRYAMYTPHATPRF